MAKAATFKRYNGSAWEELTFTPSSHTHTIANIPELGERINHYDNSIALFDEFHLWVEEGLFDLQDRVATLENNGGSSGGPYLLEEDFMVIYAGLDSTLVDYNDRIMALENAGGGSGSGSGSDSSGLLDSSAMFQPHNHTADRIVVLNEDGLPINDVQTMIMWGVTADNAYPSSTYYYAGCGINYWEPLQTPAGDQSYPAFSFTDEGYPCINNPAGQGRILCFSKISPTDDYEYYDFGETGGSIALQETVHEFRLNTSKTLTASGYLDLLQLINNSSSKELMIIVRTTAAATVGIDDASSASSTGFGVSKAVTGTTYTKITMNKTNDGYFAWDIGGSLLWTNSTTYRYLRVYTTASSISVSIKVYER